MLKKIASIICPSSRTIADSAAHTIATGYNGLVEERRSNLARYSALAKRIASYQEKIDAIIADGNIDEDEDEELRIAIALEPMVEAAKQIVFK